MTKFLAGVLVGVVIGMCLPSMAQDPCVPSGGFSYYYTPPPPPERPGTAPDLSFCASATGGYVRCY